MAHSFTVGNFAKVTNTKLATFDRAGLVVSVDDKGITLLFKDNKKMVYQPSSIQVINHSHGDVITVTYQHSDYLVTPFDAIVSVKTHRIMAWSDNHPTRKAILALAYTPSK